MPRGHAEVIRELVVPVFRGEKIKAILGVGNKSSDYTEQDVQAISLLADLAWEIAERQRAEEALRESQERLSLAVEGTNLGLWDWMVQTGETVFNERWAEIVGYTLEELAPKMLDTKIVCHLVDPRQVKEGGAGLKLEELTAFYIDPLVAQEVKGSMGQIAKRFRVKKEDVWPVVDIFDPEYLLYAGMDPILAFRLFHIVYPKIPARSRRRGLFPRSWSCPRSGSSRSSRSAT